MHAGDVSRVVETPHGYHIFLRRSPPALTTIAARRIVVDYHRDAMPMGSGPSPTRVEPEDVQRRSRSEAFATAREIASTLREDPQAWTGLGKKYGLDIDGHSGAEIGVWTNVEPGEWEREREQLAKAKVGDVLDPIDSRDGAEVLVRISAPPEQSAYAVQVLKLTYTPGVPPQRSDSHEHIRRRAAELSQILTKTPEQWDALRETFCCKTPEFWSAGRAPATLIEAASRLAIGEISEVPVDDEPFLIFAKRLDPRIVTPPPTLFDLPAPETADVRAITLASSGANIQAMIRSLADKASVRLALGQDKMQEWKAMNDELAGAFRSGEPRSSREKAMAEFELKLHGILNPEQFRRYQEIVAQAVTDKLMDSR